MFFGLTNSPATFQRTTNCMFREMKMRYPNKLFVYMDDILIATNDDLTRHRTIVHQVLDKLEEESYFLRPTKCEFKKEKIDYLGVVISRKRIHIDPIKVEGLKQWPRKLRTLKQVRSTLGILRYQRPFIPGFAHIARPLTNLLKKGTAFLWTDAHTRAVDKLIDITLNDPVLYRPDPSKQFTLEVDASAFATGAILYQEHEETKRKRPVGYHSQTFNPAERNYDIYDREFLAIIRGLENWRHPQRINRRIARYLLRLADYDVHLKHQPGVTNKADHLSRRPDYNQGTDDNQEVTALPDRLFANVLNLATLQEDVRQSQRDHEPTLLGWENKHQLTKTPEGWYKDHRLVVVEDNVLRKGVIHLIHDADTAGHPGIAKTLILLNRNYWWPGIKKLRNRIRKRMRPMPITKKHHHPTKTPPISYLYQSRSTTLRMHSAGFHYQTTTIRRIRLHINDNRPRLLKRIHIHPMQGNDRRHRSCRTLWQTRLPPLWPPTEGHLQPRPSIYGHCHEGTMQEPEHQTEHQHRLPPPDGRTIRTNQPMAGTIPQNIWERGAN